MQNRLPYELSKKKRVCIGSTGVHISTLAGAARALLPFFRKDVEYSGCSGGALISLCCCLGIMEDKAYLNKVIGIMQPTIENTIASSGIFSSTSLGFASTQSLEEAVEEILIIGGLSPEATLGDVGRLLRKDLVVVVTDVEDRKTVFLRPSTHPKLKVKRAVAASCCIPFLFQPVEIDGKKYVDGALMNSVAFMGEGEDDCLFLLVDGGYGTDNKVSQYANNIIACMSQCHMSFITGKDYLLFRTISRELTTEEFFRKEWKGYLDATEMLVPGLKVRCGEAVVAAARLIDGRCKEEVTEDASIPLSPLSILY